MNYYSVITFAIIGFIFLYTSPVWLGIIFLLLGLIVLLYNPSKSQLKKTWEEADKADGSVPEGKITAYSKNAGGLYFDWLTGQGESKYDYSKAPKKLPSALEKTSSELKELFGE